MLTLIPITFSGTQRETFDLTNVTGTISPQGTVVDVLIGDDDLNKIKALPTLFTRNGSSYLATANDTITDMAGNELEGTMFLHVSLCEQSIVELLPHLVHQVNCSI